MIASTLNFLNFCGLSNIIFIHPARENQSLNPQLSQLLGIIQFHLSGEKSRFNPQLSQGAKGDTDAKGDTCATGLDTNGNLSINGSITATGDITAFSDRRLKSEIERIEGGLEKVSKINGYTYIQNNKRSTGCVAQEVMEVLPEAVLEVYNGTAEETLYTLAYGNLAGLFVEAIKELKGELDALKKKVGV